MPLGSVPGKATRVPSRLRVETALSASTSWSSVQLALGTDCTLELGAGDRWVECAVGARHGVHTRRRCW